MGRQMFILLNHSVSTLQKQTAENQFHVQRFVEMPDMLKQAWKQIPPGLERLKDYLSPFKTWLSKNSRKGDYIIIQGDFGAVYSMVEYSITSGLVPVYATSARKASETVNADGSIRMEHIFKFCSFRQYGL